MRLQLRCLAVVAWLGATVTLAACGTRPAVQAELVAGSTAQRLEFRLTGNNGRPAVVRSVRIALSRQGRRGVATYGISYWFFAPASGRRTASVPGVLRYGAAPAGFTATPAVGLTPGAYELDVVDTAGVHRFIPFRIANDGSVTGRPVPAT